MSSQFRSSLVFMCRRVLHPLVRILLRFGISAGELKSIVDSVYAHAASEYLMKQGERVTYSKLAVITGINRAFLPTILATPVNDFRPRSNTQSHRASRVLTGWYEDRSFQTRIGHPAVLKIDDGANSFRQLAERYSGGVYHQTLLSELERTGAVRRVGDDRVKVLRRTLVVDKLDIDSVYTTGEVAGDLLNTLEHNLGTETHEHLPVRTVVGAANPESLPVFRNQVAKRADGMIEVVDLFMRSLLPNKDNPKEVEEEVHLGAAVFAFHRPRAVSSPPKPKGRSKDKLAAAAAGRKLNGAPRKQVQPTA